MKMKKLCGLFVGAFMTFNAVANDDFPNAPINIVVPYAAGGVTDVMARGFTSKFGEKLGTTAVITNLGGGGGSIAASRLQGGRPDGYTLGWLTTSITTVQPQIKNLPYNANSWTPVCRISAYPMVFFVNEDSPFNSMDDVYKAVEENPTDYIFGSSGMATAPHFALVAAFVAKGLGDNVRHIPFEGGGPALQALISGRVQFLADSPQYVKRGNFKPLMVFSEERLEEYPNVPTATELGISPPLNIIKVWNALFAPAGLPERTLNALNEACDYSANSQEYIKLLREQDVSPFHMGAEEFEGYFQSQYEASKKLIEAAGLE
ncbi:Bug family tripartite tricarboxylate transporter substrate binding protein [Paenalcaligenes sp. Me131]|uniref:Bug family tripartite tricarboxylate transporter substrate binding protein n=1 Tax=Paenalcaligenes sp. Me131 TaxID=3392636 RepID=UPI003D2D4522